ncbi:MAG: FliI/YscN family ATPase [Pirellulaceae bacterium]|nr:FliI/YscN family ATPase [Pirellulaceae bacterium]
MSEATLQLQSQSAVDHVVTLAIRGTIHGSEGNLITAEDFPVPLGAVVEIQRAVGTSIHGQVVGFRSGLTLISPFHEPNGIGPGSLVRLLKSHRRISVTPFLRGRVIDALGQPIDGKGPLPPGQWRSILREAPIATQRPRIDEVLSTGVRSLDGLLTCGVGQRMGVFAGSGVGKSVTMGMIARNTSADINVISLIGERGREVNEFIHDSLGEEGLKRSVVVVATSDQPALLRVQSAYVATAIAEYFRDQRNSVLLLMDSLTRFAMAQREIGLAAGEPPTTRGYPPSVFSMLPRLVERAGRTELGSITAFYTVLVEGDDANEPISDAVRGLLDGHTYLNRKLAAKGHYPAIDISTSLSRLMNELVGPEHRAAAVHLRSMLAKYAENEDLIVIGAYRTGSNLEVDQAIALRPAILAYLQQGMHEPCDAQEALKKLLAVAQAKPTAPPAR